MSFVNIADNKPAPKPVAQFESVVDLAHGLLSEWIYNNDKLLKDADLAFKFILENLNSKPSERNRFANYFFKRSLNRHRKNLHLLVESLRFITVEIEDLIGNATFLKAGLKNRIKNKKLFDDTIIEYKEITIMLLGISMYLIQDIVIEGDFFNERKVLLTVNPSKVYSYYISMYSKVGLFRFK